MTPLPPCPICGKQPREWKCSDVAAWGVLCSVTDGPADQDHELYVIRPTRAAVRRLWRRIAGGSK